MFPLPIKFYIYAALIACATGGILYGNHEADKYNTFKAEVEAVAKKQEAHNQEIAKQGELINQQIKVDYEKQIANIRNVYARRVFIDTNSGEVSSVPNPSSGANETSPDPVFTQQCAETTEQLNALQQWIIEQGVINAK